MTKNCVSDALRAGLKKEAPLPVRALLLAVSTAVLLALCIGRKRRTQGN